MVCEGCAVLFLGRIVATPLGEHPERKTKIVVKISNLYAVNIPFSLSYEIKGTFINGTIHLQNCTFDALPSPPNQYFLQYN